MKNKLDSLFFTRQFESEPQICLERSREFEILGAMSSQQAALTWRINMALYNYELLLNNGKKKRGMLEAEDRESARLLLKNGDNTLLKLSETSYINRNIDLGFRKRLKVSPRDMSVFCRQFQNIMKTGIGIVTALEMLSSQTENKKLKAAIIDATDSVKKGETLSASMRKHKDVFSNLLINMIEAGETSGSLETSFDRMAVHYEKDAKIKGAVRKALVYPIILSIVALIVMTVMLLYVIPKFVSIFEDINSELPAITKAVVAMSDFLTHRWYIPVGILLVVVILYKIYKSTRTGRTTIARFKLKLPVFGMLIQKTVCARFARTLGTLTAAGIPLVEALNVTSRTMDNILYQEALEDAAVQVRKGMNLSAVLKKSGLFPPLIIHMLSIGEDTGSIEEMLDNAANYYDEEVETTTAQVLALLEPAIIVCMAFIVVIMIISIYSPVQQLYNDLV